MGLILKAVILIGLTRLLIITKKPFMVAGIYAGIAGLLSLFFSFEPDLLAALIVGGIAFVLASIYFWLLWRFEDSGVLYYVIMGCGIFIGLV